MRRIILLIGTLALSGALLAVVIDRFLLPVVSDTQTNSPAPIRLWFTDLSARPGLITAMKRQRCPGAPFILPSDGFIGLLWSDPGGPYTLLSRHTGIDIFGDGEPGQPPVYAAYDGWLTRREDWLSSVIIRHDDPLQAGRTIWTYYTHMAARDGRESYISDTFPAGTADQPVAQGALLGHQGEYAGSLAAPIGLHLHFSIVLSEPDGSFRNEARLENTVDPSPYLGMPVNSADWPERPIGCRT